jgi:hypothetical protein
MSVVRTMNCNRSFRRKVLRAELLLAAILLQGCYPAWERFDCSAAYHGRLLNAQTGLPVENASLKINLGSLKASTKSGADGFFRLGPIRESRFGVMTLEGLRPDISRGWPENIDLSTSRFGYQSMKLNVPRDTSTWSSPVKTNGTWNGDLELGDIMLQPVHEN